MKYVVTLNPQDITLTHVFRLLPRIDDTTGTVRYVRRVDECPRPALALDLGGLTNKVKT